MKITDSEIIKNGEKELIDAITADLDWGAIENIFLEEHNLGIEEDIEYKSGDIVALENNIAYKLEFDVKVNLSILLDREGNYLSVKIKNRINDPQPEGDISGSHENPDETDEGEFPDHEQKTAPDDETEAVSEAAETEADNADTDIQDTNTLTEAPESYIEEDEEEIPDNLSDDKDEMEEKVEEMLENLNNIE